MHRISIVAGFLLFLSPQIPAQSNNVPLRSVTLRPADASLSEPFTGLGSIRELSDGRVILTDQRERRVVVASLATQQIEPIGRQGQGPGEYATSAVIYALDGDSSLLIARAQRRWLVLDGPRIAATIPPDAAAMLAARGEARGADNRGRVMTYWYPPPPPGKSTFTAKDSFVVMLVQRATGHVDSVARLRRRSSWSDVAVDHDGVVTSSRGASVGFVPFEEGAVLFTDGWVAVARLEPFRVDWRRPDGQWVRGAPLPLPRVRVNAQEKEWFLNNRVSGRGATPPPKPEDWPEWMPPFFAGLTDLLPANDGRLLIHLAESSQHPEHRYAIVNRAGRLDGALTLPDSASRILGFGDRSIYLVVKDADEVERVRRHPWP